MRISPTGIMNFFSSARGSPPKIYHRQKLDALSTFFSRERFVRRASARCPAGLAAGAHFTLPSGRLSPPGSRAFRASGGVPPSVSVGSQRSSCKQCWCLSSELALVSSHVEEVVLEVVFVGSFSFWLFSSATFQACCFLQLTKWLKLVFISFSH
jgi:hypothetical protein